jgi:site-specific DNA-methyltransferase (adenine-specific)
MSLPKPYYNDERSGIKIYLGDCREILPHLPKVDLVLTDPPYGLGDRWTGGTWGSNPMYGDAKKWDIRLNDAELLQIVKHGKESIVWGGNYYQFPPCRGFLSWIKIPAMETMADLEYAWTTFDRPAKAFTETRNSNGKRIHPTEKPLSLISWCIQQNKFWDIGNSIIDPFMGSGTTLRAAKDLGRKAIGIEIEEHYCEIAAKRCQQEVLNFGDVANEIKNSGIQSELLA